MEHIFEGLSCLNFGLPVVRALALNAEHLTSHMSHVCCTMQVAT